MVQVKKKKVIRRKAPRSSGSFVPDFVNGDPMVAAPVVPANQTVEQWLGLGVFGTTIMTWVLKWLNIGLTVDKIGVLMSAASIVAGAWMAIKARWFNKSVTLESLPPKQQKRLRSITPKWETNKTFGITG